MENTLVRLRSYLGLIDRVVVQDLGDILLVCRKQELEAARSEHRDPSAIGFRRDDVVTFLIDGMEHTKHNGQYESVAPGETDRGRRGPG
jgi:hypothetical protein